MFSDWLSYLRNDRPAADSVPDTPPDPPAVQSLASSVQQLCALCEELLGLASRADGVSEAVLQVIPAQIAAVRACAADIQCRPSTPPALPEDPYSLTALGEWVWRE